MSPTHVNILSEDIPRRGFLKMAIVLLNGLMALALAIPGLGYLMTPIVRKSTETWVKLGPLSRFVPGKPQKAIFTYTSEFDYTRKKKKAFVWVLSNPADNQDLTVFSAVCTHMGCNVAWRPDVDKFVCPCHGGTYNLAGEVVAGPPPRPLDKLPVQIENGQLFVRLRA
jgi:menaquinol-cytochrome c reductase iron-sulfur subunit